MFILLFLFKTLGGNFILGYKKSPSIFDKTFIIPIPKFQNYLLPCDVSQKKKGVMPCEA